jgi:cytochrome c
MTRTNVDTRRVLLGALLWAAGVTSLAQAASSPAGLPAGDPAAGQDAFLVCSACHTVAPGGPALIGPNLHGVVGRDIASAEGFVYSDALLGLPGEWNAANLHAFLADPLTYAPGTKMGLAGIASPEERANLIAYLASLDEAPAGAAASVPDFGPDWPAGPGQAETGQLCNACHSLAIVKQQGLSRDSWDELLDWMVEEQGMAEQSPEQRDLILDYLATHFGIPQ